MPNLETFFEFGGTVELLTTADTTLEKYDIIMSELMWGVDQGLRDKTGTIKVQERDEDGNLIFIDPSADPPVAQRNRPTYSPTPISRSSVD